MIPPKSSGAISCVIKDGNYTFFDDKNFLHREDGPAIARANGDQVYYRHGSLHREDGPAVIHNNGVKEYWQNDRLHRLDGPAIELPSGQKEWFREGVRHRPDGPAVEHEDGYQEFWLNGVELSKLEFIKRTEPQPVIFHPVPGLANPTPAQSGGTLKRKP